jgi:hypothetical protein
LIRRRKTPIIVPTPHHDSHDAGTVDAVVIRRIPMAARADFFAQQGWTAHKYGSGSGNGHLQHQEHVVSRTLTLRTPITPEAARAQQETQAR